ncbi:odorant receptor 22a-like [Sitodiplosis mosellana]|uniref:odorant receptor 22a-like n=1 Tax=Sitodiplosis mosellana TaxID=263140 RepID=UPI0024440B78|nr:odorant receptor 22a-like [Sitodiplosis mosellana]
MKPLATDQQILTWLCVLPAKENTSKWEKWACIAFVMAWIVILLIDILSGLMFVVKFISIDFKGASIAIYAMIGCLIMANSMVVAFLLRHKIPPVYENLSAIYEKFKDEDSFRYLAQANNKSEWFWKMYIKFVLGGFPVIIAVSSIGSVLVCFLLNGHLDVTQLFRPFRFILPWDQSTLLGYFGEIIFIIISLEFYLVYNGVILLSFVSICLHHQAFNKMLRHSLRKLERPAENRNDREFLCKLIDFHNSIKSWFLETADIYSPHFVVELIGNMLLLSAFVFHLDQQFSTDFDIRFFVFLEKAALTVLTNLFVCCYLGKIASESYEQMADCLYDYNWQELPMNLQKYFIIIIANAQIPLSYHGYGIITLNLETFCQLLRTVYTYYMMLKTLSSAE